MQKEGGELNNLKKHCYNVSILCKQIGYLLNLNKHDLKLLVASALYHDIGKEVLIQRRLLSKGKFTKEEYEFIKLHTIVGAEILRNLNMDQKIVLAVRHHHERWDGKGYPDCLKGEDIPLFSRIISIADAYDVMVSGRPYQKTVKPIIALNEIIRCSGTQFDPEIVKVFINSFRKDDVACIN